MKTSILIFTLGLLFVSCHRELGKLYEDNVPLRMRPGLKGYHGFFEFNKEDSTFLRYSLVGGDTIYGSYSINGNQLSLIELGKGFSCDTFGNSDSTLFIFLYKFNSLPAVKFPVEINGHIYYTDTAGVLERYNYTDTAKHIFVHPILMKSFRIPSSCTHAVFYMETMHVNNPDFLQYTIRRKTIRSMDGYKYKKRMD